VNRRFARGLFAAAQNDDGTDDGTTDLAQALRAAAMARQRSRAGQV